ncbi:22918_t:CDS:2, partial [Gigaspora margarita]
EGFYRVIWVERFKKMCEWENSTELEYLENSKRKTHQNQKACV